MQKIKTIDSKFWCLNTDSNKDRFYRFNLLLQIIFLTTFTSICYTGLAQGNQKYEIKAVLSPTLEKMNPRNKLARKNLVDWKHKLSYNFGVEYKHYLDPDLSFSTGLLFQDKGFRALLPKLTSSHPVFNNSVFVLSVKYISVPLNLNFHFHTGVKSRFLFSFGLTNGWLIDARSYYKRVSDEDLKTLKDPIDKNDEVDKITVYKDVFKKRYTGGNLGFTYTKYIKSKMVFELQTYYTVQLNKATVPFEDATYGIITPKFDSWALDFRLGYFFNKQIKNNQKAF